MRHRRLTSWPALVVLLLPGTSAAEDARVASADDRWSFGASLAWYFVPDQTNYPQPTVTADHGPVHLELRYNYEALRTASFFVGWNFEFGDTVSFILTPIAGCMVGEAGGPILGLEFSLEWGPLSYSIEGEWVSDLQGGTGGYLYSWSELDVRPWDWLRLGVAAQRTRVFHTARQVVFGPLVGVTVWKLDVSAYWFQPGGTDQLFVVALSLSF